MEAVIKQYYKDVKALLPVRRKYEKRFLAEFRSSIAEYARGHPGCTYEQLCEDLGSPSEVISGYFSNVDTGELLKKLRWTRSLKIAIIILVALAVALWIFRMGLAYASYLNAQDEIITKEVTIIE